MCHTWKNGSYVKKTGHPLKNVSHSDKRTALEKWVTFGKMGRTWYSGSHLEKWLTLEKMGHVWKNESNLETLVTLGKMCHTHKNGSHIGRWVKLGKMGDILAFAKTGSNWK